MQEQKNKRKIKIWGGVFVITGIVISIILGIVAYSRSNKYFLESDGEIVYCGSTIWMKLHGRDTSQENIELICKYNPPPDFKKWNGKYHKNYFK